MLFTEKKEEKLSAPRPEEKEVPLSTTTSFRPRSEIEQRSVSHSTVRSIKATRLGAERGHLNKEVKELIHNLTSDRPVEVNSIGVK